LTGLLSAVMQNPAVTALFLPVVSRICSRTGIAISRLLLPMVCCITLGGSLTMVGNSPQILLNDLITSANRNLPTGADTIEPFKMFSVTPFGIALLAFGMLYFWRWWDKLLPPREEQRPIVTPARTETYFHQTYGIGGEVLEVQVGDMSPLTGRTILEIESEPDAPLILASRIADEARLAPPADLVVDPGSVLGVIGPREQIENWAGLHDARVLPRMRNFAELFDASRAGIAEAVVPPASRFVGQTVGELRLRKRYGISVLAVNRGDKIFREGVRQVPIKAGDTLVLHGFWRALAQAAEDRDFVVVTDYPKEEGRPHKIYNAVFFFALGVGLALFSDIKLPVALLSGALGMLLTGVLTMDEAYQAVSWKSVFLMACLIPLGWATDATGAGAWMAQELLRALNHPGVLQLELAVALLTTFLAMVMSNVGATVVMVPLAINIALATGGKPAAFAMLVALSASNNFVSASNPVIAIIAGPAGYRTGELWRVGMPLSLGYLALILVLAHFVF
jgi:di/tricarboxylate transporter